MSLLLIYDLFKFTTLFPYALYHLISSTISFYKPSYTSRPYHPFPISPHLPSFLRHLHLILLLLSLLSSILFLSLSSSLSLSSLHTSISLALFIFILLSILLFHLPNDLTFLLSSLSFALLSRPSYNSSTDLQSIVSGISATVCMASSVSSFMLCVFPKMYVFDLVLSCSVCVQGLWSLVSGLCLYVERFVPEGCHALLDVTRESTRCDVEESRVRAGEVLWFDFEICVLIVAMIGVVVFVVVGKVCAGGGAFGRRLNGGGSYEALPTVGSVGAMSDIGEHVQMKALGKSSAQE